MEVRVFQDAGSFLERAGPFLLADEAGHNLLLGVAATLIAMPRAGAAPPYLVTVERRGAVLGAAIQTPPSNLILSRLNDPVATVAAIVADRQQRLPDLPLPGVIGPRRESRVFAETWGAATGKTAQLARSERIYQLARVTGPE